MVHVLVPFTVVLGGRSEVSVGIKTVEDASNYPGSIINRS